MTDTPDTAQFIFDHAPLGAVIAYSDGAPKPPARFTRKLEGWERRNRSGRLVKKQPASTIGASTSSPSFTLHTGDFGANGIVVVKTYETILVTSPLRFRIEQTPPAGSVRILSDFNGAAELVHLAPDQAAAEAWLSKNSSGTYRLEPCEDPAAALPRRFTYLQDPSHGWLLVTRAELEEVGLDARDLSCCSYVDRDVYALEEDCDMPLFLERLAQRGVAYQIIDQHIDRDAHVRRWQHNPGRRNALSSPSAAKGAA